MRFPWPPSEEKGWTFETVKQSKKQTNIFFPIQKHKSILLGVRIREAVQPTQLTLLISEGKAFKIPLQPEIWTMFPYPIESHATESVWQGIELDVPESTLELAYYHWENRQFRMRALIDSDGAMLLAYRINKNGQTVTYLSPKDHTMTLPEDTYVIPPTSLLNEKSIVLHSAQSKLPVKKAPEGRYFLV